MSHPAALPHDPIEEIDSDLFMVRGSVMLNRLLRLTRNMAIVRHGGELTLINPVRLSEKELERLNALGTVRHLIRTGAFHGLDDPFYVDRYRPEVWCQAGGKTYPGPPIDHELAEDGPLPFPDARLFCFRTTRQPECMVAIERGTGILLPCDAIQHYGDYSNCNLPTRLLMPWIGFPRTTLLGPFWLKLMSPEGGDLRDEFARLLAKDFQYDRLLSAHGTLLGQGAKAAVRTAILKVFPDLG